MCTPYIPWGDGYCKISSEICAPWCIEPQDDGTVSGTCQGIYKKKDAAAPAETGAPPAQTEMAR